MKVKILKYLNAFLIFITCSGGSVLAQTAPANDTGTDAFAKTVGWLFFLAVLILFVLILVYGDDKYKYSGVRQKSPALVKLKQMLTRSVPVEHEQEIMFEHDFDGIRELDNKVPPWFNILFYGTIIFGIIYMLVFHVFRLKPLSTGEYVAEVRAADMQREELIKTGAFVNEETVKQLTDPESIQAGKDIFMKNCTPCHGLNGEGTVGPNLTDDYWLQGGGIKNIFKTIKYGVPAKGMITWQNLLNPKQIQEAASYVMSLHGTNPPNGKPPEGNLYVPPPPDTSKTKKKSPGDSTKTGTSKVKISKGDSLKVNAPKSDTLKEKSK
jgi:cytochrome c oxidase cbb3-type subunit 3